MFQKDHVQLFSRTTTGHYQPWMLNLDVNGCDYPKVFTNSIEIPGVARPFLTFLDKIAPEMKKGCPFNGSMGMTEYEFDKEAVKLMPPMMPEGNFCLDHRFHTLNNQTLLHVKLFFEIRPNGTAELIKLG